MKTGISFIIISSLLILLLSFNYTKEEAMEILKQNCPDSYDVVNILSSIPVSYGSSTTQTFAVVDISSNQSNQGSSPITKNDFTHWLKKENSIQYLTSFSTAVHESYHGYNSYAGKYYMDLEKKVYASTDDFLCYYINQGQHIIVKKTETFPSAEMASQFSFALKMERFSTYISPSSNDQSTQQDGVYALLDEWNAYYLGMKTLLELIPFIKANLEPTADNWKDFFFNINSDFIAYTEFKLYILNYLLYSKSAHPEMYKKIIENKLFVKAYHAVDNSYSAIVEKFLNEKVSVIDYLTSKGLTVSEDETAVFFGTDGIGNYVFKHKKMLKEFAKDKYADVLIDLKE